MLTHGDTHLRVIMEVLRLILVDIKLETSSPGDSSHAGEYTIIRPHVRISYASYN